MHQNKLPILLLVLSIGSIPLFAQNKTRPAQPKVIIKSNVLSLLAGKPTLSIEKPFKKGWSVEGSFSQGNFNNFLFTDHYDYNGFLLRLKKYLNPIEAGRVSPYVGLYAGNLKRHLQTAGQTDNSGLFSFPDRNFSSNSIRSGTSLGFLYLTKTKIVMDLQASLGYGRYLHLDKNNPNTHWNGYLDAQLWLSFGYLLSSHR